MSKYDSLIAFAKQEKGRERERKKEKLFLVYGKCWVLLAYEKIT